MSRCWALALLLALTPPASAVECDDSGFSKTMTRCSADRGSKACQDRMRDLNVQLGKCEQDAAKRLKKLETEQDPKKRAKLENEIRGRLQHLADLRREFGGAAPAAGEKENPGAPDKEQTGAAGGGAGGNGAGGAGGAQELIQAAQAALEAGRYPQAEALAAQALKADPDSVKALTLRAQARMAQGDKQGAVSDARKILGIEPDNEFGRLALGHGEDLDGSESRIARQKFNPESRSLDSPGAGTGRSIARRSSQAPAREQPGERPAPQLASPISFNFNQASAAAPFLRAAAAKLAVKDYSSALDEAVRAVAADPANAKAWAVKAGILNKLGRYDEAIKDATESLRLDRENPAALLERGYALYQAKRYLDALADLDAAIALDPVNALGYFYRALVLEKLKQVKAALDDYAKAAGLDPALRPLCEEGLARLGAKPLAATAPAPPNARRTAALLAALAAAAAMILFGAKRLFSPRWNTPLRPAR